MTMPSATSGYAADNGIRERTPNQSSTLAPKPNKPATINQDFKTARTIWAGPPPSNASWTAFEVMPAFSNTCDTAESATLVNANARNPVRISVSWFTSATLRSVPGPRGTRQLPG